MKKLLICLCVLLMFACGKKKDQNDSSTQNAQAVSSQKIDLTKVAAVYSTGSGGGSSALHYGNNVSVSASSSPNDIQLLMKDGSTQSLNIGFAPKKIFQNKFGMVFTGKYSSEFTVINSKGEIQIFNSYDKYFRKLTEDGFVIYTNTIGASAQELTVSGLNLSTGSTNSFSIGADYDVQMIVRNFVGIRSISGGGEIVLDVRSGKRTNAFVPFDYISDNNFYGYSDEMYFNFDTFERQPFTYDQTKYDYSKRPSANSIFGDDLYLGNTKYEIVAGGILKTSSFDNIEKFEISNLDYVSGSNSNFITDGDIVVLKERRAIAIFCFQTKQVKRILEGFNVRSFDVFGKKIIFSAEDNYGNKTSGIYELDTFKQTSFAINGVTVDQVAFIR